MKKDIEKIYGFLQNIRKGIEGKVKLSHADDIKIFIDRQQIELQKVRGLLNDYQCLIQCDYGKIEGGLYMDELSKAIGGNASNRCEKIYLKTEKYFLYES